MIDGDEETKCHTPRKNLATPTVTVNTIATSAMSPDRH
jgi:hypothetical protein